VISKKVSDTKKLARKIAKKSRAQIFALVGELGSGKTTFVQAFLRAKGVRGRITSPTFLIIRRYPIRKFVPPAGGDSLFVDAYHIDCYRLKNPKELLILGFKEILKNPRNVILIEWADKIKKLLTPPAGGRGVQWIYFEHGPQPKERLIRWA